LQCSSCQRENPRQDKSRICASVEADGRTVRAGHDLTVARGSFDVGGSVFLASILTSVLLPGVVAAIELGRPDAHAPITVMGDHVHRKGEWMLSYRYMRMDMEGNRSSAHRMGEGRVLRDFPVTPKRMDMEMHVFGVMWAVHEGVTLMGMVPLLRLDMDHVTRAGVTFTTRSKGLGDIRLTSLIRLAHSETQQLHANLGVSFPTGSITEKDDTPMGHVRLPYPMQLGSGTLDLLPGVTWNAQFGNWSAGAQALGTIRMGRGGEEYRLGHRFETHLWGARMWAPWLSTSVRLGWRAWGDIEGKDDRLNPAVVSTADPNLRDGRRLDLGAGINVYARKGSLRGHRLGFEFVYPVNEWLDGPQLETDWLLTFGWQKAF
jgi:hypothetical protein